MLLRLVTAAETCSWHPATRHKIPLPAASGSRAGGEGQQLQSTPPEAVRSVSASASLPASVAVPTPGTRTPQSPFRGRLNKGAGMRPPLAGPLGAGLTCPGTFCFLGTESPLPLSTVCPLSTKESGLSPPAPAPHHWPVIGRGCYRGRSMTLNKTAFFSRGRWFLKRHSAESCQPTLPAGGQGAQS